MEHLGRVIKETEVIAKTSAVVVEGNSGKPHRTFADLSIGGGATSEDFSTLPMR